MDLEGNAGEDAWSDLPLMSPQWPDWDQGHVYCLTIVDPTNGCKARDIVIKLGSGWLVTAHGAPVPSLDLVWENPALVSGHAATPYVILCTLVETLLREYAALLTDVGHSLTLTEQITDEQSLKVRVKTLLDHRRLVRLLHRTLSRQQSLLVELAGHETPAVESACRHRLLRAVARTAALSEEAATYRDIMSDHLQDNQAHMSAPKGEMTRILAYFTAIFMPLTLITGIYGMNFRQMPGLDHPYGFWITIAFMLVIAAAMFWWFRREEW